ncbi:MAG TPA: hypothetical protein PLD84_09335, partial [Chitinophagales bacterium]|nr:hypothetical protein [Chitinophagales bacterium]
MKNIYATLLLVLLVNATAHKCTAQWIPVYQDMNAQFYDGAFPTDNTGYVAASDNGAAFVLRTKDGGITWDKKHIPGWGFIDKMVMIDSVSGYLIKGGVPGKILKTNDGFNTYTGYNTDTSFIVQAISLLNDSTGFYLNNAARLRKFKNNGAAFIHVIDTLADGQNLQFINAHTGYLDTGNGLLMTTDGGVNWNFINNDLGFYCVKFNFADSLSGYFSDFTTIYKTNDGGVTFSQQYSFSNVYSFAVNGNFCMAANDTGNVAYTNDGGLTWQTEITGINLIAPEPYKVITSPGGSCFLFSQFCGEIRKRKPLFTGTSDPAEGYYISVYPNPFSGQATLHADKMLKDATLMLYNSSGQKVKQEENISGQVFTLQRGGLPIGSYFF